jgi:NADH dehydrogenase (ubiquinone) Fe-S protein 1
MLRQSLARSAWRTGRRAVNVSRSFATTPQRHAEVELTIGECLYGAIGR